MPADVGATVNVADIAKDIDVASVNAALSIENSQIKVINSVEERRCQTSGRADGSAASGLSR